ncbi:MAG: cobyrinate a,c-diamide synthase [Methanoregulaceae archaeon]|jgi:cobyrinic acid a,c-diamide synthase|nr:cobyrinate a,c-diamide synthase [Methanoregulaceae archaeon]
MNIRIPRILIAGTHSGCGKTTISRGLMQAFTSQGLVVQPFKVGPDFIDPTHHTSICGRASRNLDPFMMGEDRVRETFVKASRGADIAVIEGVMGMFDGLDGTLEASSAHVADLLGTPVLLVVDVKGMSRSAHAIIRGFAGYPGGERIAGVIFNRLGSGRHRSLIERSVDGKVLGWVKRRPGLEVKSRHLGLVMASELGNDTAAGDAVREDCDTGAILEIARKTDPLPYTEELPDETGERPVIGVARDEAFCFYYQDNLDLLAASGADLVFFSPIHDPLPKTDALYLGGGYPELHAGALESSATTNAVAAAADRGMPVYAECGGLLFLSRGIYSDREYRMAGVLPACAEMTGTVQALGYSDGRASGKNSYIRPGMKIKGHEFHYSRIECMPGARFVIDLSRGKGISGGRDGLSEHETTGSYTHSYFSTEFSRAFVNAARIFKRQ